MVTKASPSAPSEVVGRVLRKSRKMHIESKVQISENGLEDMDQFWSEAKTPRNSTKKATKKRQPLKQENRKVLNKKQKVKRAPRFSINGNDNANQGQQQEQQHENLAAFRSKLRKGAISPGDLSRVSTAPPTPKETPEAVPAVQPEEIEVALAEAAADQQKSPLGAASVTSAMDESTDMSPAAPEVDDFPMDHNDNESDDGEDDEDDLLPPPPPEDMEPEPPLEAENDVEFPTEIDNEEVKSVASRLSISSKKSAIMEVDDDQVSVVSAVSKMAVLSEQELHVAQDEVSVVSKQAEPDAEDHASVASKHKEVVVQEEAAVANKRKDLVVEDEASVVSKRKELIVEDELSIANKHNEPEFEDANDDDNDHDDDKEGAGFEMASSPAAAAVAESSEESVATPPPKKKRGRPKKRMSEDTQRTPPIRKSRKRKGKDKTLFSPEGYPVGAREMNPIPVSDYKESPPQGVRRSHRAHMKPLAYWKNERPLFGPHDEDGELGEEMGCMPVVKSVLVAGTTPRKRRKAGAFVGDRKRLTKVPQVGFVENEKEFDSTKLRKKYKIRDDGKCQMWDEELEEATEQKVVCYAETLPISDLPIPRHRKKADGKVVGRAAQSFNIPSGENDIVVGYIMGSLVLPPKGLKDSESTGQCSQVFTVCNCQPKSVEIAYGDPHEEEGSLDPESAQRFLLSAGDQFRIPPGNAYLLKNHSTSTDCLLAWTIIRPRRVHEDGSP